MASGYPDYLSKHSFADRSSTSGLLLDLGRLDPLRVDGDLATVGPGLRIRDLRTQLAAQDLSVSCGWCPDVAVGGAVLGGGYGMLSRLFGLGSDHLVAAQVVLADGRVLWCDERREPDLFWALRGSGVPPGVVTSLVLRARPVVPATVFECRWPYQQAAGIINTWLRWAPEAPEQINAELTLVATHDPDEEPHVAVFGASVGAGLGFLDVFRPPPAHLDARELTGRATAVHSYPEVPDDLVVTGPPPGPPPGCGWRDRSSSTGSCPSARSRRWSTTSSGTGSPGSRATWSSSRGVAATRGWLRRPPRSPTGGPGTCSSTPRT